jgi:hypothetical protein
LRRFTEVLRVDILSNEEEEEKVLALRNTG